MLAGGRTLQGKIIQATRNGVAIKRMVSGMAQYRQDEIREVNIDTPEGAITGSYVGWADGVYTLEVENGVVRVQNGKVINTRLDTLPIAALESDQASIVVDDAPAELSNPALEKARAARSNRTAPR